VYLLGVQAPRHTWDLRQMMFASADCQACIQSAGLTMGMDSLTAAQCLAYDQCNAAITSQTSIDTCMTQSGQLYDAECVCRRDQLAGIMQTCQQSSATPQLSYEDYQPNLRLCDVSENMNAFKTMSCTSVVLGTSNYGIVGSGPWTNNGDPTANWGNPTGNNGNPTGIDGNANVNLWNLIKM
jgi:hypothetical protein